MHKYASLALYCLVILANPLDMACSLSWSHCVRTYVRIRLRRLSCLGDRAKTFCFKSFLLIDFAYACLAGRRDLVKLGTVLDAL